MVLDNGPSRDADAAAAAAAASAASRTLQRRAAIKVVRGVTLAAHSAAGVVMSVSKEAERLVRSAEGILRAAAALLEVTDVRSPTARSGDGAPRANGAGAAGADVSRGVKARKKKKKKNKDATQSDVAMHLDESAHGASHDAGGDELGDEWADDANSHAVLGSGSAPAASVARPRVLKSQSSRERSPRHRRDDTMFKVGSSVKLRDLVTKPNLNDKHASISNFNPSTGRYGVRLLFTGESIQVKPECLELCTGGVHDAGAAASSFLPGSGQVLYYESSPLSSSGTRHSGVA